MGITDALGSMGQNLGRSLTGNIVKAVICVRDPAKVKEKEKDSQEDIKDAKAKMVDLDKKLLEETKKKLNAKSAVMTYDDLKKQTDKSGFIPIEVQYNPGSIRLSSSAGLQYDRSGEGAQTQAQAHETVPSTTLSCELLFDDTNVQDAFMLENNPVTNLSTGNVYNAVKSGVHGKYSVQSKVEGFISLFAVPQAKEVIFFWANMCFRGEMTGAEVRYTMFNKKGYPIRASVNISIRQGSRDEFKVDKEYWNWAFDRAFGKAGVNSETAGKSTLDNVMSNNLLNLKL